MATVRIPGPGEIEAVSIARDLIAIVSGQVVSTRDLTLGIRCTQH